jgi:hypothetical protein
MFACDVISSRNDSNPLRIDCYIFINLFTHEGVLILCLYKIFVTLLIYLHFIELQWRVIFYIIEYCVFQNSDCYRLQSTIAFGKMRLYHSLETLLSIGGDLSSDSCVRSDSICLRNNLCQAIIHFESAEKLLETWCMDYKIFLESNVSI